MIGYVGWAVIFTAFFGWEALGLRREHDGWPTLSDVFRVVMERPVGRWVVFGLWMWLGWHLFVRGWHFFLRGPIR
jgi:hypothetical protein